MAAPAPTRWRAARGDDTYVVDNAGDMVTENGGAGHRHGSGSSVTYTLAANVENLTLTGTGDHQRHRQYAGQHDHRQ